MLVIQTHVGRRSNCWYNKGIYKNQQGKNDETCSLSIQTKLIIFSEDLRVKYAATRLLDVIEARGKCSQLSMV